MKYRVLRDCYGFRNASWTKGQIVDVSEGEKPPSHFEPVDKPPVESKETPTPAAEPADNAGKLIDAMTRKELIATGKRIGIENAHMLSSDKLREVLKESNIK
jgi:hypothetical protein